eukprot:134054-Chlamydomonas_euryale.AAC.1
MMPGLMPGSMDRVPKQTGSSAWVAVGAGALVRCCLPSLFPRQVQRACAPAPSRAEDAPAINLPTLNPNRNPEP